MTEANELVHLAYVNPETGTECLPVLGFSSIMLRPGEMARRRAARLPRCCIWSRAKSKPKSTA